MFYGLLAYTRHLSIAQRFSFADGPRQPGVKHGIIESTIDCLVELGNRRGPASKIETSKSEVFDVTFGALVLDILQRGGAEFNLSCVESPEMATIGSLPPWW